MVCHDNPPRARSTPARHRWRTYALPYPATTRCGNVDSFHNSIQHRTVISMKKRWDAAARPTVLYKNNTAWFQFMLGAAIFRQLGLHHQPFTYTQLTSMMNQTSTFETHNFTSQVTISYCTIWTTSSTRILPGWNNIIQIEFWPLFEKVLDVLQWKLRIYIRHLPEHTTLGIPTSHAPGQPSGGDLAWTKSYTFLTMIHRTIFQIGHDHLYMSPISFGGKWNTLRLSYHLWLVGIVSAESAWSLNS